MNYRQSVPRVPHCPILVQPSHFRGGAGLLALGVPCPTLKSGGTLGHTGKESARRANRDLPRRFGTTKEATMTTTMKESVKEIMKGKIRGNPNVCGSLLRRGDGDTQEARVSRDPLLSRRRASRRPPRDTEIRHLHLVESSGLTCRSSRRPPTEIPCRTLHSRTLGVRRV
jgi:hypothetical protein